MKCYLVGGAVRDQLLNYPVLERDYVVVGSTPESMVSAGYKQVGHDFPVFLHPQTREEYALARKERKVAVGYYGFKCDFDAQVTLEEDLGRRDLTINAMAIDEQGHIVDPYQGLKDLEDKILRHVSNAFVEDPVRVLRVARFAARYHHLGFKVALETRLLMYKMVTTGELNSLVAERVWQEFFKSLQEKNPEQFITVLRSCGALAVILPEVDALYGIPATRRYHPEVDSGIHSLQVLKEAVKLSTDPLIRFAALVHDLGKTVTPFEQWPKHHGHDFAGIKLIESMCNHLHAPIKYRDFAVMVCRFHLNIHRLNELSAQTIIDILNQTDAFRRPQLFDKLLLVCAADACRVPQNTAYKQADQWRFILHKCLKISASSIIERGYHGVAIKNELHNQRVTCATLILNSWKIND